MIESSRIFVAGHRGLVGSAITRRLRALGYEHLIERTHAELELRDQRQVNAFFESYRPEYVFMAAARVGGIHANNSYPADFIRDNLVVQDNIIDAAFRHGVRKLLFLGSSCIYPRLAEQPIKEDALLTGPLEPTNEWYAIAKIAGIKLCQAYRRQYAFDAISIMPTNLYGPGDNFNLENAHVLPALMRKFHDAVKTNQEEVVVWGTGKPRREFLHVDDLADAVVYLMRNYSDERPINVGVGTDVTIRELAGLIADVTDFRGSLRFDDSKPDGTPRKLLDVSRLRALGWEAKIGLKDGLRSTYEWFKVQQALRV